MRRTPRMVGVVLGAAILVACGSEGSSDRSAEGTGKAASSEFVRQGDERCRALTSQTRPLYASLAYILGGKSDSGRPRSTPDGDKHVRQLYTAFGEAFADTGEEFGRLPLPARRRERARSLVSEWERLGRLTRDQFRLYASLDDLYGDLPAAVRRRESRGAAQLERSTERIRALSKETGFEDCGRGLLPAGVGRLR